MPIQVCLNFAEGLGLVDIEKQKAPWSSESY